MDVEYSRALLLGSDASGSTQETLLERLQASRVAVSIDPGEANLASAAVLVETLRRLPVRLALDPAGLGEAQVGELVGASAAIDPRRPLAVRGAEADDLRVRIGGEGEADVFGTPIRHGARVGSTPPAAAAVGASGLGSFTCAALLAGEVFKRVAAVLPERASFPEDLQWCPVTLGSNPAATPGLGLAEVDLALVGLGAIGSASARILAMLGVGGRVALVDSERLAPENLGTYSLGTAAEAERGVWKTELVAAVLAGMSVSYYQMRAEEFATLIDRGGAPWPRLVLGGLDSAQARREVQRLWPDRLIDGATGGTSCGMHDVRHGLGPCLLCLFGVRAEGKSASVRLAEATGLPEELLRQGQRTLRESDIAGLGDEQRRLLAPEVGKPVCGLAEAIGLTMLADDGYRPSVPFVSQQAACLVVGRLVATLLELPTPATFVQYDALVGPLQATAEARKRTPGCFCEQRVALIEKLRAIRGA